MFKRAISKGRDLLRRRRGMGAGAPREKGPFPLILGVTGHRDLLREDELREVVRGLLAELRRLLPHTPFVLLSPLAEGADQLVAEVALEEAVGAELVAVLPFGREEYGAAFSSSRGREGLERLLAKARDTVRVPDCSWPVGGGESQRKDTQYALAGSFVARHSHLLIALWDGEPSRGTGGTAQVVAMKRLGRLIGEPKLEEQLAKVPEPFGIGTSRLDPLEPGWVAQVVTPHEKYPNPESPLRLSWLAPEDEASGPRSTTQEAAVEALGILLLDECNRDCIRSNQQRSTRSRKEVPTRDKEIFPDEDREALDPEVRHLLDQHEAVDGLANEFQRKSRKAITTMGALVSAALVMLLYYTNLAVEPFPGKIAALAFYLIFLLVADLVFVWVKYRIKHRKYLDYRALAEGLRVQMFWRLAGVQRSVADDYLRWQRSELGWIRQAIRAGLIHAKLGAGANWGEHVRRYWVEHQLNYFAESAPKKELRLIEKRLTGQILLGVSLVLAFIELIRAPGFFPLAPILVAAGFFVTGQIIREIRSRSLGLPQEGLWESLYAGFAQATHVLYLGGGALYVAYRTLVNRLDMASDLTSWLTTAMALAATGAALVMGQIHTLALSDEARQADRMRRVFQRGLGALAGLGGSEDERKACLERLPGIAEDLGREALSENADWLLLHRRRPVERPHV
jgi:hypothetical protein